MARKKWKRKSGYVTPNLTIPKKELIKNDLFLNPFYDEWNDWRDGMRDWFSDYKLIKKIDCGFKKIYNSSYEKRIKMNHKQKKLLKRRKARNMIRN
tara:strand:+ start:179 stop:466 length:288 start_codon:yes stop_codon:yes gene_type:complete